MFYLIDIAEGNITKNAKSENFTFSNSSSNVLRGIAALNSSIMANNLRNQINQLNSA
jgi:hypothetical protein